jgi:plasminogen activator inhibitor 1 RNA-binding protein
MDYFSSNAFSMLDEDAPMPVAKKEEPKAPEPKKNNTASRNPRGGREGGDRREGGRGGGERGRGRGRGEGRGRGRGEGRGRGRGPPRDGPPRERREFDRHESGTGRDRNAKKGGAGKYNWGTEGDQGADDESAGDRPPRRFENGGGNRFNNENNNRFNNGGSSRFDRRDNRPAAAADATKAVSTEEASTEDSAAVPAVDAVEQKTEPARVEEPAPEPEPPVITYDEYLEQLEAKRVEVDRSRKVRVVENDESQWKSCAAAEVEDVSEDTYAISSDDKAPKEKAGKKKTNNKLSLDQFKSAPGARSGGRGRGRGGPRGGRGGNRGGRGTGGNFDLAQSSDQFPTLGGK